MQKRCRISIVALSLMVVMLLGGSTPAAENITGSFWYAVDHITKAEADNEILVWVTLPPVWHGQKVTITDIVPEPVAILEDEHSGNRVIEWHLKFEEGKPPLNTFFHYDFELVQDPVSFAVEAETIQPYDRSSDLFKRYTQAEKGIQTVGLILDAAREIVGDEVSPQGQTKAVYSWLLDSLKFIPGGSGDRNAIATLKSRRGDCGQFSSLFVGLCRSIGIPSRTVACAWTTGGRHVFAEYYLPGIGWIPADPALGQMLMPDYDDLTTAEVASFMSERGVPLGDPMWTLGNLFSGRLIITLGNNIRFQSPTLGKKMSFQRMLPGGIQALPSAARISGLNDDFVHGGFFVFGEKLADNEAAHALVHQKLAGSFFNVGLYEVVEDGCLKSLDADSSGIQNWINMGKVYMHKGQYYKAEAAFKRSMSGYAARRNEKLEALIWSHNYLGNCYDLLGHRDMALEEYQHVVDMDNDYRGAVRYASQYLQEPFTK